MRRASPAFEIYHQLLQKIPQTEPQKLRHERHVAWCECALATFFSVATAEEICAFWSDAADSVLLRAWNLAGLSEEPAALFALGKLGARELNLSSDVDLMIIARPEVAAEVEKKLREFRRLIHHRDDWGSCFRIDFDLRPGGTMGPVIVTPSQFQDHYWSQGEAWERLALVRMRLLTGPEDIHQNIMDLAQRFSFRKFLDYSLLEDFKALRSQIHQSTLVRDENQTHLKLGMGGIRDIELFLHSLLVMNGGKISNLRVRSTSQAAQNLAQEKLLPPTEAQHLLETYWYYRQIENQLQAVSDTQTHALEWSRLPALWNWPTEVELRERMKSVDSIVSGLLGRVNILEPQLPATAAEQEVWLRQLGYSEDAITNAWPQLIKATALSYKNDRDEWARRQFLYAFIEKMKAIGNDHNLGLHILVDFVKATRAKATFFSLLLREPLLLADLARMFSLSPYLGAILSARPELLDNFILMRDEEWSGDLSNLMEQASSRKLLIELRSANSFLRSFDLDELMNNTTRTADEICSAVLDAIKRETGSRQLEILALGKWGGREMGLRSDLDFIFMTPDEPRQEDFKAARRFISRISDPQKGGMLYGMDLRLRPSGQAGAILIGRAQLELYWRESAAAWERQAYLRMRPLRADIDFDKTIFVSRGLSEDDARELHQIRGKLLKGDTPGFVDLKYTPGGLLDIEFVVQTLALKGKIPVDPGTVRALNQLSLSEKDRRGLEKTYRFLRTLEQLSQLSAAHSVTRIEFESESFARACALWKKDSNNVIEELTAILEASRATLNRIDPTGYRR